MLLKYAIIIKINKIQTFSAKQKIKNQLFLELGLFNYHLQLKLPNAYTISEWKYVAVS